MENKNLPLDMESFACLLLAKLADNSRILDESGNRIIYLPAHYKQIIENVLCEDNGWKKEFSILLDVDQYFKNHFRWEKELSNKIIELLDTFNKHVNYDFRGDNILIAFSKKEIDMILEEFDDETVVDTMDHFANLLTAHVYTRRYQEEYHDYSAVAVKKMHDMKKGSKKKVFQLFKKNY